MNHLPSASKLERGSANRNAGAAREVLDVAPDFPVPRQRRDEALEEARVLVLRPRAIVDGEFRRPVLWRGGLQEADDDRRRVDAA